MKGEFSSVFARIGACQWLVIIAFEELNSKC